MPFPTVFPKRLPAGFSAGLISRFDKEIAVNSNLLLRFAAGLLLAASALPSAAVPPNIVLEEIRPELGGVLVVERLAPPTTDAADAGQLSIDLYLRNLNPMQEILQAVSVQFPGSAVPGFLANQSEVRCPAGSDLPTGPVLPFNQLCRVTLLPDAKLPVPLPPQVTVGLLFWNNPVPLVIARPLALHANDTSTGSYRFPGKVSDLPDDSFWAGQSTGAGSHHRTEPPDSMVFAYDMGVVRFDEDENKWVDYHPPTPFEVDPRDTNDDFLGWNVPIYAIAAGEVVECADGNPDNVFGSGVNGAANYIQVETGAEVVWYYHLKNGSIDPAICFNGALVEEGQLLARMGNSGDSSAPHLHLQVTSNDVGLPLHFNDSFVLPRTSAGNLPDGNARWAGMDGAGPIWEKNVIWPSGLRRRDEITGVAVEDLVMASGSSWQKVTVARDAADNLRTDLWNIVTDVELDLQDTDTGGALHTASGSLAAAQPKSTNDVTAVIRTAAGNLKLISYNVTSTSLSRAGEYNGAAVQAVAATTAPFSKGIVTAVRKDGALEVRAWESDVVAQTVIPRGYEPGGAAKTVAVAGTDEFTGVVTAVRNAFNHLTLATFSVTGNGFIVDKEDDFEKLVTVVDAEVAWVGSRADGTDLVVTAAERLDGKLEVTAWAIDPNGILSELDSVTGGEATDISVARVDDDHALTAMSDSAGNFRMIAWHITPSGQLVRRGETVGGEATAVAVVGAQPFYPDGPLFTATALRTGGGNLKVIDWQVLLTD